MKLLKQLFTKNKDEGITKEMKMSYAKHPNLKQFNQDEFNIWFSAVIYHYHPINNQFYN